MNRPLIDVGGTPANNPMSVEQIMAQMQNSMRPVQGGTPFKPVDASTLNIPTPTLQAGQQARAVQQRTQQQQTQARAGMTAQPGQVGATVPQTPLSDVIAAAGKAFTPAQQISPGVFAGPGKPAMSQTFGQNPMNATRAAGTPLQQGAQFQPGSFNFGDYRLSNFYPGMEPLTPERQAQLAQELARMQTDPMLQEIDRQLGRTRLSAEQEIGDLTGPAFQSLMTEMDRAQSKGFSAAAQRANERGMLFSPLGRGEFRDVEEAFANQRGRVAGEQALSARRTGERFGLQQQQYQQQREQLLQQKGLIQSAMQDQLRQGERAFAAGDVEQARRAFAQAETLRVQAFAANEDVRQFDASFNENQRQFDASFGEDQRQFNALGGIRQQQERGLRLGNDAANQQNYITEQFRGKYGFAPEESALYGQNLSNATRALQNQLTQIEVGLANGTIDPNTPAGRDATMKRSLLQAQIDATNRSNTGASGGGGNGLTTSQIEGSVEKLYDNVQSVIGSTRSGDEKVTAIKGAIKRAMKLRDSDSEADVLEDLGLEAGWEKRYAGKPGAQDKVADAETNKFLDTVLAEWESVTDKLPVTPLRVEDNYDEWLRRNEKNLKARQSAAKAMANIMEKKTGMKWDEFVQEHVLPAQLPPMSLDVNFTPQPMFSPIDQGLDNLHDAIKSGQFQGFR